ncbi:patatin-like phospholipase family protein [Bradyrhizobium canariense]|uniref:NTE family protein n=1 Tax=Bradyrhizobium canariense TaxID=255045 RepID=A0A1H1ZKN6_9BRAD|nr:patatin-like phospholipase family protein [Bradyrhizobium canariense]SDT34355.1 NTE family protein [Bradyrhizobium canariense]
MGLLAAADIWSTSESTPSVSATSAGISAPAETPEKIAIEPDVAAEPETVTVNALPQSEAATADIKPRSMRERFAAAIWPVDALMSAVAKTPEIATAEPATIAIQTEPAAIAIVLPQSAAADDAKPGTVGERFVATSRAADETRDEMRVAEPLTWPPRKLSLALQGGGSFAAFTWGVLERLLEEPGCEFDVISGASAGAVNAVLLASGLAEGGREGAHARLRNFWARTMNEASFRSQMLLGGFSPAGSTMALGPALRSGQFDPFDLDPLRQSLERDISFAALRDPACPKLLIAATRVRDGRLQIFRNRDITADVLLASTCPPQVHCAVEIDGHAYWDGGYSANPPVVRLVQESETADVLVVQVTPARDSYIPMTMAAIDRRVDQITANLALNAEIAALEWARDASPASSHLPRIFRIAAEDEIDGLAQRSAVDLGRNFITLLHRHGRAAADRWLTQAPDGRPLATQQPRREFAMLDAKMAETNQSVAEPALA